MRLPSPLATTLLIVGACVAYLQIQSYLYSHPLDEDAAAPAFALGPPTTGPWRRSDRFAGTRTGRLGLRHYRVDLFLRWARIANRSAFRRINPSASF